MGTHVVNNQKRSGLEIAVIGMSGRFPGAGSIAEFWQNLRGGVESISFFSDEELIASGVSRELMSAPNYVRAKGVIEGAELFDAAFFGYSPMEAQLLDPQQRLFLEQAWEALEGSGYTGDGHGLSIGVYSSSTMSTYLANNLLRNPEVMEAVGWQAQIANNLDFQSTRASYKLNLTGPSVVVQSACSSSLVAVHLACQGLLSGDCDVALAGGSSLNVPQKAGYVYEEGGIVSPDGHCRAFDAEARGTVRGDGVAIVVLKRLVDAVEDGDVIHAIIRGSAINNDGSLKISYTAPSVEGQESAVSRALAMAEVHPETVGFVETHGTATELGDLIEFTALKQAFGEKTQKKAFCALGSVKTNIGHLDAAAGVTGLIKAVLALKHKELPASLHFQEPNPKIDFADSPFYVNAATLKWTTGTLPRRAGVSSFGIGGTNAHLVLEEAFPRLESGPARRPPLILLSARTLTALDAATKNLVDHLKADPDLSLADAAYTLQVGRKAFEQRRMVVCRDREGAIKLLSGADPGGVFTQLHKGGEPPVAFMFPGQGAQYVNMGLELYHTEPVFRHHLEHCCEVLRATLGFDLRDVLYPGQGNQDEASERLKQTAIAQPALFVIEYALAQLWISWGVRPQAMIGHSIGEYVAACLAGVFSVESGLELVAIRGRLMQDLPGGAMVAVPLSETEVRPLLTEDLSLAALNAPTVSVVSGTNEAVDQLVERLAGDGTDARLLHTSHAFHSRMMDPILQPFRQRLSRLRLNAPRIPWVSNVTGRWITDEEATDAGYWSAHIRQPVRFSEGAELLLEEPTRLLLEVGPGRTLGALARQQKARATSHTSISSLHHPQERQSDQVFLMNSLGRLWLSGVQLDWRAIYSDEVRHRLPLPTYPFERQRYWIEPGKKSPRQDSSAPALQRGSVLEDWFYVPSWKRSLLPAGVGKGRGTEEPACWLIFADGSGLGAGVIQRLNERGQDVFVVREGHAFARVDDRSFAIVPQSAPDYARLFDALREEDRSPSTILHLWSVGADGTEEAGAVSLERSLDLGFYSLLYLAQALNEQGEGDPQRLTVVTSNVQEVTGEEFLSPARAMALGPCRVIPQELPNLRCRTVDVCVPASGEWGPRMVDQLILECLNEKCELAIAYRGSHRWIQTFDPVRLDGSEGADERLRERGVYLITGGFGRIGLTLGEYLAKAARAKLVLVGRSGLPPRDKWGQRRQGGADSDLLQQKIAAVQRMEELGSEVMLARADVSDAEQMRAVVGQAVQRFGALHGVIHGAGCTEESALTPIAETGRSECRRHFAPKAAGLLVLEEVLRGMQLDFVALFSSLASVLGGHKFVAYSAANLFMDAFAQRQNRLSPVPWISVLWDGWRFDEGDEEEAAAGGELLALAMRASEGVEAFRRTMGVEGASQVAVSTVDLGARIDEWIGLDALRGVLDDATEEASPKQPRGDLQSTYAAPRNEAERKIASIWQDLLGIEQVGIHDNFFELGGHSLLGTRIISRVRQSFEVGLPLRSLLERPTVAELTLVVVEKQIEQADERTVETLLAELEQVSDEDAERALAARVRQAGEGDPSV